LAALLIETKVRDYTPWRVAYDAHEPSRIEATITNGRVYCRPEDPNDMLLLFDVADVDKARPWTLGEDLKGVMNAAGVLGTPTFTFIKQESRHTTPSWAERC
jgi:hypothetical protein